MMMPVALLVFVPRMFDRIQVWFGAGLLSPFDIRTRYHQELQETFLAMTVCLYRLRDDVAVGERGGACSTRFSNSRTWPCHAWARAGAGGETLEQRGIRCPVGKQARRF
jgi:hypothetical protein